MGDKKLTRLMIAALIALLTGSTASIWAQTKPAAGDKPANNLEIIHEKLKADKKLIVANYMVLTESEAKTILAGLRRLPKRFAENKRPTSGDAAKLCCGLPQ